MFGEGVDEADCSFQATIREVREGLVADREWTGSAVAGDQVRVRASYPLPAAPLLPDDVGRVAEATAAGVRNVVAADGSPADIPVHLEADLAPGQYAAGPALVSGDYLTCVLDPGWSFRVSGNSDLILEANR
jgi:N-methylhydantoinase A/oxoprolinase/acetone carboxylase beta subunit